MEVLRKIIDVLAGTASFVRGFRARLVVNSLKRGEYYGRKKVPFIDQLQGPRRDLVVEEYGEILDKKAARRFGARNLKEYSYWAWRSCGMANLAMVFAAEGVLRKRNLFDLVREGLLMNGYAFKNKWGQEDIGWKHDCLLAMCKKEGLSAKNVRRMGIYEVVKEVVNGNYVIVSVESRTGGHMILVKGFKISNEGAVSFLVNNPYVFENNRGEDLWYEEDVFSSMFLSKAIVINND